MTLNFESHRVVKEGGRLPVWAKLEEIASSDHSWLGPVPLLHILFTWVTMKGMYTLSQARPSSVLSKRIYLVHLPLSPNASHRALFIADANKCSPDRGSHLNQTDSISN